jgi:uracil-DNA glycosylase family 4
VEEHPKQELATLVSALALHVQREARRGRRRTPLTGAAGQPPESVAEPAVQASPPVTPPTPAHTATPIAPAPSYPTPQQEAAAPEPTPRFSVPPTPPASVSPSASAPAHASTPSKGPRELAAQARDLAELRASVAECLSCPLHGGRQQTVFAQGTGQAQVMFVGAGPTPEEDQQGLPFVGESGELLAAIITKGLKLPFDQVHLSHLVKCRPRARILDPALRDQCAPWLDREFELVQPKVVILLGEQASQHFLGSQEPLERLRGRIHSLRGVQAICTYHPGAMLQSPHLKSPCWKDIQLALELL